jgi:hypothetical protein
MKKVVVSLLVLGAVALSASTASARIWHHHVMWRHHHVLVHHDMHQDMHQDSHHDHM